MRWARPSVMAVLPTPASPTWMGLFLSLRQSTWTVRSISASRPITGSSLPSRADLVRSEAKRSRGFMRPAALGLRSAGSSRPSSSSSSSSSSSKDLALGALAVGDDLEELEALDARLAEVIGGVVALLVVEGDEDVGDLDLFLARGLGLEDGALDDALEARGLHRLGVLDLGDLLLEVGLHAPSELLHVGLAGLEYGADLLEGEGRVKDMLRGQVLVVPELRLVVRGIENGLNFLADLHLRLLHGALERETVLPRELVHLINLRHGNVITVDAHGPFPLFMHVQHYPGRLGERLVENGHEDGHDEFHRGEVVVEEEDSVLVGLLEFLIGPGEYLAL